MKNDHKLYPFFPQMHGTARTKQKGWILFVFNGFIEVINLSGSSFPGHLGLRVED